MPTPAPIPLGVAPAVPTKHFCRHLTVKGIPCRQRAMIGESWCVAHRDHRFPVCPSPRNGKKVAIPLMEDLDTVQVIATQVAQGLFAETLDPWRAGKILYACQIAALTLPRPARLRPSDEKIKPPQPVADPMEDIDGALLGPEEEWIDPNQPKKKSWTPYSKDDPYYDGCRYGQNNWCSGRRKINCCGDCRRERLAELAEAEIQRDIFLNDRPGEVILSEMVARLRQEADARIAAANPPQPIPEPESAPVESGSQAAQPQPPSPETARRETQSPETIETLTAGAEKAPPTLLSKLSTSLNSLPSAPRVVHAVRGGLPITAQIAPFHTAGSEAAVGHAAETRSRISSSPSSRV